MVFIVSFIAIFMALGVFVLLKGGDRLEHRTIDGENKYTKSHTAGVGISLDVIRKEVKALRIIARGKYPNPYTLNGEKRKFFLEYLELDAFVKSPKASDPEIKIAGYSALKYTLEVFNS